VDESNDAIIVRDLDGKVIGWNAGAEKLLGYSSAEILGLPITRLCPPELLEEEPRILHRLEQGDGVEPFETARLRKDGQRIAVSIAVCPIRGPTGQVVAASEVVHETRGRPVAARVSQAAGESERSFRQLAESLPQLVWTCEPDGACKFLSRQWVEYTGIPASEQLGHGWLAQLHPDDRHRVATAWNAAVATGSRFEIEYRIRRHDGAYRWFDTRAVPLRDAEGRIVKWFGSNTDVHEAHAMHKALLEQQERFTQIAATVPGVICSFHLRPDATVCVPYSSPGIKDIYGLQPEELAEDASVLFTLIHPDDVKRVHASVFESARTLAPWHEEFRVLNPEKGEIWVAGHSMPRRLPDGGTVWHGILVDETERKRAEEALRESEAWLLRAQRLARVGHWESHLTDGTQHWSDQVFRIFGFEPGAFDPTFEHFLGLVHPEDREALLAESFAARREHREYAFDHRILLPDGSERVVHEQGDVVYDQQDQPLVMFGTVQDITERKRAEEALRQSEERLRIAIEAAGLSVWTYDPATEEVASTAQASHWSTLILEGEPRRGIRNLHPDDRAAVTEVLRRAARTGEPFKLEARVVEPNGTVRWFVAQGRLIAGRLGAPPLLFGVSLDITERKRAEEAQLRSQKLEALGTLAGGIAHDFNNILLAIIGNAKLAMLDLPLRHPARLNLAEIDKASARAAELVRRILSFTRHQEPMHGVVALQPVIEEVLKLLRSTLPAMIEIETRFTPDVPAVNADATQIHQVVMNLATNSAHAIGSKGGRIEVGLEGVEVSAELAGASAELHEGRYARLSVSDDGCGMDKSTLPRIFDPFFTTKPPGQGTGLGLSTVHGIMKSLGGAITVRSEPGKGAVFHLYFPAAESPAAEAAAPLEQAHPGHGERVLYVDDEDGLVLLLTRTLHRLGYQVTGLTEPAEALRLFEARPEDFDVVVTDLAMPGMSGFELARRLLAVRPDVPILMVSGHVRPEDQETALQMGIRQMILKPGTIEDLGRGLDHLFQELKGLRKPPSGQP
jgi:PAS domain S-box-containing protein